MPKPFSQQLEQWLKRDTAKSLASVTEVFGEKSFAIIVLLLMFLPALPIPTGGITHIFEIIVLLLALELMAGRRTVWLPKKWQHKPLGKVLQGKVIPIIVRRIRWFERYSRPRLSAVMVHREFLRFVGLLFFICALGAIVAPPFSGLDTLPALGAVILALAVILEDAILFVIGSLIGAVGIGIVLATGQLTLHFITRLVDRL